jgi:hypothetical protein
LSFFAARLTRQTGGLLHLHGWRFRFLRLGHRSTGLGETGQQGQGRNNDEHGQESRLHRFAPFTLGILQVAVVSL